MSRAPALLLLAGCTLLTHAGDFAVEDTACNACPQGAELRHPPCPSGRLRTAGAGEGVYYFAARSIDLGADPREWDAGYWVGEDQDCSARPQGAPVLCVGSAGTDWVALPGGVDNSLAAQTFAMVVGGERFSDSMQRQMNAELAQGKWGLLLVVTGWNGLPDDDAVGVRLLLTRGLAGEPNQAPRWDTSDYWNAVYDAPDPALPNSGVPDVPFKGGKAYVAGGTLVWDGRDIESAVIRLENNASGGVGAMELLLANFTLEGQLSPDGLSHASIAGVTSGANIHVFPDFVAGRDARKVCALRALVHRFELSYTGAAYADMPTPPFAATSAAVPCSSVSVGFGFEFAPAGGVGSAGATSAPPAPAAADYGCDGGP